MVQKKYDLVVLGGGFAGVAAAVSASRGGLHVLLVESSNALGGAANINLVNPFMRYATTQTEDTPSVRLSCGIFKEITDYLETSKYTYGWDHIWRNFHEEYLKLFLQRLCLNSGVNLLYNTTFVRAFCADGRIESVELINKSGPFSVYADAFIDATGDADVAFSAGCPTRLGREDGWCQPMTLCFRMGNVDMETFRKNHGDINKLYAQFRKEGKLKNPREDILTFELPLPGVVHFNSTRIVKRNPTDGTDLTFAEIEAKEQVFELVEFMRTNAPGFERAELLSVASRLGVRESRMIDGEYILTKEDIMVQKKFPDGIAACCYDMDIHNPEGTGTTHWFLPKGEYYTIPFRCLIPKGCENLLVAGRCISTDHDAQASYRIMPVVCCIGEAAGWAAVCAHEKKQALYKVDSAYLLEKLRENGCFVG